MQLWHYIIIKYLLINKSDVLRFEGLHWITDCNFSDYASCIPSGS